MSSLPLNAESTPFPPASFEARKSWLLKQIAGEPRFSEVRTASQLEVRPRPEMLSSGIAELDAISGGIPCGCMSVICGSASSGKTSALLAALAKITQNENTCVLIDASDSFDPKSGAAAGIDFSRLLWVRCGGPRSSLVQSFANKREPRAKSREPRAASEFRLEQVLKTTDLVLQSGGFSLVVLDLAGIPEKFVRRIPLASWFRFQRAVEHTKTALLIISEFSCAQTCAALVLKLEKPSVVSRQPSGKPVHAELLNAIHVEAELVRSRLERKPMQSVKTNFTTQAVRAG